MSVCTDVDDDCLTSLTARAMKSSGTEALSGSGVTRSPVHTVTALLTARAEQTGGTR